MGWDGTGWGGVEWSGVELSDVTMRRVKCQMSSDRCTQERRNARNEKIFSVSRATSRSSILTVRSFAILQTSWMIQLYRFSL